MSPHHEGHRGHVLHGERVHRGEAHEKTATIAPPSLEDFHNINAYASVPTSRLHEMAGINQRLLLETDPRHTMEIARLERTNTALEEEIRARERTEADDAEARVRAKTGGRRDIDWGRA